MGATLTTPPWSRSTARYVPNAASPARVWRSWRRVGAAGRVGEAGERPQVGQRLAAADPPVPLPADRRGEPGLEQHVERLVGVGQHAAKQPVDLLLGHRLEGD